MSNLVSKTLWILGIVVVFIMGIAIGATSNVKPEENTESITSKQQLPTTSIPEKPPVPVGPATSVGSGTYEVGKDMEPGQYKTPASGDCYWARLKDDSGNFEVIIANDILSGQGTVTVNVGEFFEASGNCFWTKVK